MNGPDIAEVQMILTVIESYALEHCDEEANVEDTSPKDMDAHRNGLIVQLCRRAKELLK